MSVFVRLSYHLSACLWVSISVFVRLSYSSLRGYVCMPVSVSLSFTFFVSRTVYASFHASVLPFISTSMSVYLKVRPSVISLCVCVCVYNSVRPSVLSFLYASMCLC